MYTSQTDHRPRRDVSARLYRHFGVFFRTARFHKFFGYREVMLTATVLAPMAMTP